MDIQTSMNKFLWEGCEFATTNKNGKNVIFVRCNQEQFEHRFQTFQELDGNSITVEEQSGKLCVCFNDDFGENYLGCNTHIYNENISYILAVLKYISTDKKIGTSKLNLRTIVRN